MLKKRINRSIVFCLILSLLLSDVPLVIMADENSDDLVEQTENVDSGLLQKVAESDFNTHLDINQETEEINVNVEKMDTFTEKNVAISDVYISIYNKANNQILSVYRMGYTDEGIYNLLLEKQDVFGESIQEIALEPVVFYDEQTDDVLEETHLFEKVDSSVLQKDSLQIKLDKLDVKASDLTKKNDDENATFDENDSDKNQETVSDVGGEEPANHADEDLIEQSITVQRSEESVIANLNDSESELEIWTEIKSEKIAFVQFAVWSEANGQDDLKWYRASQFENGYKSIISGKELKEIGTYIIHAYYWDQAGNANAIGATEVCVSAPKVTAIKTSDVNNSAGTFDITLEGLTAKSGISEIRIAVWSAADQSDIYWYTADKNNYSVTVDLSNHKYHTGTYNIHTYVWDGQGRAYFLGPVSKTVEFGNDNLVIAQLSRNEKLLTLTAIGAERFYEANLVQFAIWSNHNGQDDLRWIVAGKNGNSYTATISALDLVETGAYTIHAYYWNSAGEAYMIGTSQVVVSEPSMAGLEVGEFDEGTDCFTIKANELVSNVGISTVRMAVWCAEDQSDICWYTAVEDENDYRAEIDLVNHKYHAGTYKIHMYVQDGNGRTFLLGATSKVIKLNDNKEVSARLSEDEKTLVITARGRELIQNANFVQFAVWSEAGGQDDLKWVMASNTNGVFQTEIKVADLHETGTYMIHAYYWDDAGTVNGIGSTEITVSSPTVGGVIIEKKDYGFRVNFDQVYSHAGIEWLNVAVWCNDDRSYLTWTPVREDNGSYYLDVHVKNYGMAMGVYHIHVYAVDGNGIQTYCDAIDYEVKVSSAGMYAEVDKNGICAITIKDLYPFSGWSNIGIAAWSSANGQDDLTWYSAVASGSEYRLTLKPGQLKELGRYLFHAYAIDAAGHMYWIGNTEITYSPVNVVSVEELSSVTRRLTIYGASYNGVTASAVSMPTWTSAGNQDDIIWIPAQKVSDGIFSATVNGFEFNRSGDFITHIYGTVNGVNYLLAHTSYRMNFKWEFNDYAKSVMRNIIYAVETGGQIYGNAQYNCFAPAYNISSNEKAITIGAGGWYATEAQKLLKLIREANPTEFAQLDTAGIGEDLDTLNWRTYGSDGNGKATILRGSTKAVCIQVLISTSTGKAIQDQLVDEEMTKYIQEAMKLGVTDLKAQMFLANIRHLGGFRPMAWVVECCIEDGKELTMQNLYDSMRNHTPNKAGNGVGADIYNSRHKKVMQWLNTHIG